MSMFGRDFLVDGDFLADACCIAIQIRFNANDCLLEMGRRRQRLDIKTRHFLGLDKNISSDDLENET